MSLFDLFSINEREYFPRTRKHRANVNDAMIQTHDIIDNS